VSLGTGDGDLSIFLFVSFVALFLWGVLGFEQAREAFMKKGFGGFNKQNLQTFCIPVWIRMFIGFFSAAIGSGVLQLIL
tara:strand:+ start:713 stop:949 length:237 start_codon:yes stop_codon:yes gene_type:complete